MENSFSACRRHLNEAGLKDNVGLMDEARLFFFKMREIFLIINDRVTNPKYINENFIKKNERRLTTQF